MDININQSDQKISEGSPIQCTPGTLSNAAVIIFKNISNIKEKLIFKKYNNFLNNFE